MGRLGEIWEEHLLPRVIDVTCSDRATGRWREQICAPLAGDVLEVGFGSGTNLRHYPAAVRHLSVVEPSELAWRRARKGVEAFGRPVDRIGLDGAELVLADASVDAVVSAYTMCTIPELETALAEFQRVLRPGGALHFVEHSLSPDAEVAARQHKLQPRWGKIAGGCHLVRDIPALVRDAGFTLVDLEERYAPGPKFSRPFGWLTIGRATF
ncbi:ubiquinone/menaquinone biosynthesis C-methylase UbiE [Marmoricola sp. OAE513]|uniref:class I SAM-dependent methyltransferase n=1 Tax=Marmoricola sp. OAE513 TaxID=2817894 RepID=UPI001AE5E04D